MTQQNKISPEQEKQLRQLFKEIGPAQSMHVLSGWLSDSASEGNYGPQFRDSVTGVVTSLRETEQTIRDY